MSSYASLLRRIGSTVAAAVAAMVLLTSIGQAQTVTVVVNGQTMTFDQPPIERAGRVFVPLRGVFERLGASVVYANGQINATGNGRNVSLNIGSTNATVNGQPVTIDVAPFLVGPRTMVPLRFIAQSLGATVNYNDSNRTVTINGGGAPAPQPGIGFALIGRYPSAGSVIPSLTRVSARFSRTVDPSSLRVYFDGRDITSSAYVNSNGFNWSPQYTVPVGSHSVRVTGNTGDGGSFDRAWSFTVRRLM